MRKTFRYRIYPTKKQLRVLEDTLEECRWLYNETLNYRKHAWEKEQRSVSRYETQNRLPSLKAGRTSLIFVHSQVLQNVTERVHLAFQAFFRRVKAGENPGYPRFKGKGRYDSFTYAQSGFSLDSSGRISLSKIGSVKMAYHRPIKGTAKTCTISRSPTGKWYACFSCECEPERLPDNTNQVGIDVGLKTFATLSDGQEIANPRFFRKEEKSLAKARRKLSKTEKETKERHHKRKVVARVYERSKWRRQNFTHQNSRRIVNQFGTICVEDLHVNRMVHNHCLAKSIHDAAWSAFFDQLSNKAEEAGYQFIRVNPAYTSQTCSTCGHRQPMPLSERIFDCPCCHLHIDRDLNAANNILGLGRQSVGEIP